MKGLQIRITTEKKTSTITT